MSDVKEKVCEKDLVAPKLTNEMINNVISKIEYTKLTDTLINCALTLRNGFIVTGESSVISPENFVESTGKKIAYENAKDKIWVLEGYLLKQKLFENQGDNVKCGGYRL